MKVTIENKRSLAFSIHIEDASREDVIAVREVTDVRQRVVFPPNAEPHYNYANPREWDFARQQAFLEAARLYFGSNPNKILTIKHLRILSDPILCLKDAKDLVDYALDGTHGASIS